MAAINLTKDTFEQEIATEKTVLVDFWAPWCGPCKMMSPVIDAIADERTDVVVAKVNVDDERELAEKFGIMSIPTLVILKNGEVVHQESGAKPKNAVLSLLDS